MTIRPGENQDLEQLAALYREFYPVHDIFQRSQAEVIQYLETQKDTLLVYDDGGSIQGAVFLVRQGGNESHTRWKFRHCAFASHTIASDLLREAERRVSEVSDTVKIELTITENEPGYELYTSHGYEQEGALSNHYRWGETCYILSKSYSTSDE